MHWAEFDQVSPYRRGIFLHNKFNLDNQHFGINTSLICSSPVVQSDKFDCFVGDVLVLSV